jgi:predicted esterase
MQSRPLLALVPYAIAAFAVVGSSGAAQTAALPPETFAYVQSEPLGVTVLSHTHKNTWAVDDLTFTATDGKSKIHANLVSPDHPSGSAVLFVHWLGDDPKTTNLGEFMPDALALAAKGTTSLLVDAPWAEPGWFEKIRTPSTDYAGSISEVKNLRRSLDVLLAAPGVDAQKLAYVGHDFGAMYGAVLSGVDPRPKFYVLAAGTITFSEWFLLGPKPADQAAYIASLQPLDPPNFLARAKGASFLFQFANHDTYIPLAKAQAFAAAAPEPKRVVFYDTDHSLATPAAFDDRVSWLDTQFGQ